MTLIGRLTADPNIKHGEISVAKFSIAVDRGKDKDGKDKGADFPSITCFGKTADLIEKYMSKGRLVGIIGRIQTGSYEKDGVKHYTTDVIAERVEFLDRKEEMKPSSDDIPTGFTQISVDDIPF